MDSPRRLLRKLDGEVDLVTDKISESALGISTRWFIAGLHFEPSQRKPSIRVDFEIRSRFPVPGQAGEHPVHDTVMKTYRYLNFFQHESQLTVRAPRQKPLDGNVMQVTGQWAGKLPGSTLLFEAFALLLVFTGAAGIAGLSVHRVMTLYQRHVNEAVTTADYSHVRGLAIAVTSKVKRHEYVNLFTDEASRKVIFVAEGNETVTLAALVKYLCAHRGKPTEIESVGMTICPAFIQ